MAIVGHLLRTSSKNGWSLLPLLAAAPLLPPLQIAPPNVSDKNMAAALAAAVRTSRGI